MDSFRKIATIHDHKITIHLPDSFESQQVEIIIRPYHSPTEPNAKKAATWQEAFAAMSCWDDDEGAEPMQSWPIEKF